MACNNQYARYIYLFHSLLLLDAFLVFFGCGGTSTVNIPVAIALQPLSQTVPLGSTATFTVVATGTAPLSYQWNENGVPISGANSSTYTTPTIALDSSGSTLISSYQVTVSNAAGSVTSNAVTLTAGPRSPKAGDLRYLLFQQVDIPGFLNSEAGRIGVTVYPYDIQSEWADNAVGSPLSIGWPVCSGTTTCAWGSYYQFLPPPMTGLNMYYQGGIYSNFTSDLKSYAAPNVVFTSMDLEPAANAYAVSWVWTNAPQSPGVFDYRLEVVPPSQISTTATADGAASRVITAVSFDANGQANLISYGWTGDTTTVYETQTNLVPPAEVAGAAAALAGQGYVISAFGGNDTLGYVLVGMRVQGDSLPRPIFVDTSNTTSPPIDPVPPYYTPVVNLFEASGTTSVIEQ